MTLLSVTTPRLAPAGRRVSYFGMARQKNCMNCGRPVAEGTDLYSRRFCSVLCKDEYCSPLKKVVRQI